MSVTLWFESGLAADLSGAAAVAALATGKVVLEKGTTVSIPVCGAGLPVGLPAHRPRG
ncbi:hypothetical protein [Aureimonas populi]|uniref:Uncharacterized protein n=1 Tax=Aureimonas populi TaxID=1701758 RepID=A0ABW5CP13_9HYPH|nr:hypothetical protein [Aureimonas populi]